jgi:hypothetical protein
MVLRSNARELISKQIQIFRKRIKIINSRPYFGGKKEMP